MRDVRYENDSSSLQVISFSCSCLMFVFPTSRFPPLASALTKWAHRFGLFPFRSPLLRESSFFLFLGVLRCFSSPGIPLHCLMVLGSECLDCSRRVSPFGNPRINACLQLPEAYRSLPRPSSAPGAKAFALCSL
jgi:hypothetical protein